MQSARRSPIFTTNPTKYSRYIMPIQTDSERITVRIPFPHPATTDSVRKKWHNQPVELQKPQRYPMQRKLGRHEAAFSDVLQNCYFLAFTQGHAKSMNHQKAIAKPPTVGNDSLLLNTHTFSVEHFWRSTIQSAPKIFACTLPPRTDEHKVNLCWRWCLSISGPGRP